MIRRTELGRRSRELRPRLDEILRIERAAAVVALITARIFEVAVRAFALDVAIREKALGLRVVRLNHRALLDEAVLEVRAEEVLRDLGVIRGGRRREQIEMNAERGQPLFVERVIASSELLWRDALLFGGDRDRRPVHVGAADHQYFLAAKPQVSRVNIRRK